MELRDPACIAINEPSQVGEARRAASTLAQRLNFDANLAGQIAIAVTEAGNNLVRHTRGGEVMLRPLQRGSVLGLEIMAIDKGPGIRDLSLALRDGFSTAGTPGTGLGAIKRLSGEFDLFSSADPTSGGVGTVVLSRFWNSSSVPPPEGDLEFGVISLPVAGEEACGDSWAVVPDGDHTLVMIADGLGHGIQAAEASHRAVQFVYDNATFDPVRLIETMHTALRSTRGAAVSLVELRLPRQSAAIVGVGNISSLMINPQGISRTMTSHNGTVGVEARRIQSFSYEWRPGSTLIMHSDGISGQWQLSRYPGLINRHPSVIAAVLFRDHRRVRDDATVLVARKGGPA